MATSLDTIFLDQRASLIGRVFRLVGCRQTAEDLVQESYLRTVHAVRERPIAHVQAFLYQTARNLALDHLRRERTRRNVEVRPSEAGEIAEIADTAVSTEQRVIDMERLKAFERALAGAPVRAQQAVILNRLHGWSYPRIAAHLGVSPNTVYNDIRAALAQCFDALMRLEEG
ncbi:DNA-directed RNA polymerase sigma-70 factor [Azorhizobium oxalatiphilum]|uniref:DNA-directed RNA polymerase sigma-70 factor n=1 Tax=Azorhizobium oxalatiphilum TaxID=980631 RepID=A0A917F9G4_9HYPH|nr:RNA polymerase sigma factor [Azorhizobium oxalatiphilum]GGF58323.1 DNA-directed RNA polymerase sigma-70 factor [Azorhizobium oxalatiphilum]